MPNCKLLRMVLLPLLAVVAIMTGSTAYAADTWLPSRFNPNQHVYIEPGLTNASNAPVNLTGLEQELVDAGKKHGLQIYFVMAERGTENIPNDQYGTRMVDKVLATWSSQNGWPADDYLILTVFRLPDDWTKTARGYNPGSRLTNFGVSGQVLQDILNSHKARLGRNDVRGYLRDVGASINGNIDAYYANIEANKARAAQEAERQRLQEIADREAAIERAKTMESVKSTVIIVGPPLVVIIILVVLFLRSRKRKAEADALLSKWRTLANRLAERYTELQDNCFGFLDENKGWEGVLKNRSLAEFKAGLALYAQFTQAQQALLARFDAAEKAFNGQKNPFGVGGYAKTIELLTVAEITVTGNELTIEQRTLFGDTVQQTTYQLEGLLESAEAVYNSTKTKVLGLKKAFDKSRENKEDIARLLSEVDALNPTLVENGLTFAPYQARYNELIAGRDAFIKIMNSDPLEATDDSQEVEDGCGALKDTINKAIALKQSFELTERAIVAAEAKVATTRGAKADNNYPEGGDVGAVSQTNLLNEKDGNPDDAIASARESLGKAQAQTLAGKLTEAAASKAASEESTKKASDLVDAILAARAFVKKEVPNVRANLGKLTADIPAGDESVDELNASFQKKNFEGQPTKLVTAKKVKDSTEAELAKVRTAFIEQRYLAARALLENVGHDIQAARDGIVEVHTCLKALRVDRERAKATVVSSDDLADSLKKKLADNAFTTAARTDDEYARLLPILKRQKDDVAQAVTDWPAARAASEQLLTALKAVETAIDEQKRANDLVKTRINEVASGVESAATEVNHRFIRRPAQAKLEEAQASLTQLRNDAKVAKSDWNAIVRRADAAKGFAEEAKRLSKADRSAGADAESAIQKAEQKISSVAGASYSESKSIGGSSKTYGSNVRANTSSAASTLSGAQSALRNKEYEKAKSQADSAYSAAQSAERQAEQETAALIAAAVAVWEAAERRRREEEERERREAQRKRDEEAAEQRRRDDDNRRSSSSSFDSSSGSGSSGFSGSSGSGSSGFD